MRIELHKDFTKQYKKLPTKLQVQTKDCIKLLTHDPNNVSLRRHRLKGDYRNYWSISISGDYRALYEDCGSHFLFIKIGSHSELYG